MYRIFCKSYIYILLYLYPFIANAIPKIEVNSRFTVHQCVIDGIDRTYKIYIPENLKKGAPLLFVLHGYTGNFNLESLGFNFVADKYGFAVCYPQGVKDGRGYTCWNVGYPFQKNMKVDDVSFLCKLAKKLQKEYKLSPHSTFCTGMSNGGEMCYLLAYCGQKTIRAVVPVAGLTLKWMPEKYSKARPLPVFEIHGTEDRVSEWAGDPENKAGWGAYLSVPSAIDFWIKQNNCETVIEDTLPLKSSKSHKVITHKYQTSKSKNHVWLYEVKGGGHSWSENDLDIGEEVWKFLSQFVR